jgi:hypothetical protein
MGIFSRLRDRVSRSLDRDTNPDRRPPSEACETGFSPARAGDDADREYALAAIAAQARNATEIEDGLGFYLRYRNRQGCDPSRAVGKALDDLVRQQRFDDAFADGGESAARAMESMTVEQQRRAHVRHCERDVCLHSSHDEFAEVERRGIQAAAANRFLLQVPRTAADSGPGMGAQPGQPGELSHAQRVANRALGDETEEQAYAEDAVRRIARDGGDIARGIHHYNVDRVYTISRGEFDHDDAVRAAVTKLTQWHQRVDNTAAERADTARAAGETDTVDEPVRLPWLSVQERDRGAASVGGGYDQPADGGRTAQQEYATYPGELSFAEWRDLVYDPTWARDTASSADSDTTGTGTGTGAGDPVRRDTGTGHTRRSARAEERARAEAAVREQARDGHDITSAMSYYELYRERDGLSPDQALDESLFNLNHDQYLDGITHVHDDPETGAASPAVSEWVAEQRALFRHTASMTVERAREVFANETRITAHYNECAAQGSADCDSCRDGQQELADTRVERAAARGILDDHDPAMLIAADADSERAFRRQIAAYAERDQTGYALPDPDPTSGTQPRDEIADWLEGDVAPEETGAEGPKMGFGFVAPTARTGGRGDGGPSGEAVAAARESVDNLHTQRLGHEQRAAERARDGQVNLWSASEVAGDLDAAAAGGEDEQRPASWA